MIKKILIQYIILVGVLSAGLLGEQKKFVVRIQNPTDGLFHKYSSPEYDIAAFRPGEYLDLVVGQNLYNEIKNEGNAITITQTESQLKQNLRGRDLDGYRNYNDLLEDLQVIESLYPDICKLYNIGNSRGKEYSEAGNPYYDEYNHEIWAMKVSDNVDEEEDEPSVFYMAEHHAREPISLEVNMYILNHLISNYGSNQIITDEVNNKQIWFVPLVNPNGHKIVTDEVDLWWRKNIRDNNENGSINFGGGDGVDPNRNYEWNWGGEGSSGNTNSETYRGPSAFSEPEIQAMGAMLESHHFVTGITYHSYSELVLFPFGYANNIQAPDHDALQELANEMAYTIPAAGGGYYDPIPSWQLYPASGTTDDYAYGEHGVFSFTIELGTQFIPPASQIEGICEDNLEAALILLKRSNYKTLTGHITDAETGDPVVAEIYIDGIDNTGEFRKPYESDLYFGRYYRLLQDGTYDVTFSAPGYESITINDIGISLFQQTVLDVELVPVLMIPVIGIITDGYTGAPIGQAQLILSNDPENVTYSDNSGNFSFPAVYEGDYSIYAVALNYSTVDIPVTITVDDYFIDLEMYTFFTESFETEEFTDEWMTEGNAEWYFDTESVYDGIYSVRSGDIDDNENSNLSLSLDVTEYGSLGFHYRVASEYSGSGNFFYDGLIFYINGEEMGQFQPTPEGDTPWIYISYSVSPGEYTFTWSYVKDSGGGSTDMEEDCTWIDVVEFPPTVDGSSTISLEVTYPADWNLVSLPVSVDNNDMESIFPNAVENSLFSFDVQYNEENQLFPGVGYWIRFENENINSFTGYELNEIMISINEGWNLIGGLSNSIDIGTGLIDPDGIIVPGTVYGFIDGAYENVPSLSPGYGHWIRSLGDGEITLTGTPTSLNRKFPDKSIGLEKSNILEINGKPIYFGGKVSEIIKTWYSLPPIFEGILNDVRFSDNTYVSENGGTIHIINPLEYSTFTYNISKDEYWKLTGENFVNSKLLNGSGTFQLAGNISNLFLEKTQFLPDQITVRPSFPNPFNNETRITFSIPHDMFVSINIFNLKGELINTLMNKQKTQGSHSIIWTGIDNQSRQVSSGTYFLTVYAGEYRNISKIILLK